MDRVDELVQLVPLTVGEQARLLVAARVVDVHVCHCCDGSSSCVVVRELQDPARWGRSSVEEEAGLGSLFVWLRVSGRKRVGGVP